MPAPRQAMAARAAVRGRRLPFFYGWVMVGAAFLTMGVAVNARTAFSLLLPPILDEFGWPRSLTAGAFSFGFLVSAAVSPFLGWLMDRYGPRVVLEMSVGLLATGLMLAPLVAEPWHLYATLGVLVGSGANCLGYTGHALFLPNWFVRRRGLAMSVAFSGVGAGSIILMPWLQGMIEREGWRPACATTGVLALLLLIPANLVHRRQPEDLGLEPDGGGAGPGGYANYIVDPVWAAVDWTLSRALRTARFWWIATGYLCAMFAWYAVQVHQTRYLVETGVSPTDAAWALGLVSLVAVPGQIALGHLSDRIGREWVWTIGCVGFGLCYLALIVLGHATSPALLYLMVVSQGMLGYGLTSVIGAIPAEIFAGRHYGTVYGSLMLAAIGGGALGPWITGVVHDSTGSYAPAFWLGMGVSGLAAAAIWLAAPRQVRAVARRVQRA
jgi:MFS family permease